MVNPAYAIPLHPATPYFTWTHPSLPYPRIMVKVTKQKQKKKIEIIIQIRPKWPRTETTHGRNDSAPTIICEPGLCSVSQSINFYKTLQRMMVLLLTGGVRTKKEKQPRNFHLNLTVVYNLLVWRYTDAIKLTTVHCLFALNVFLFERRKFVGNKINI